MDFLISIFPTLLVLGILILIHEFGHFIACRLTKVKVEKFSIGFGPEIFHWQGKETRYTISLLPLGGFVKPQGESVSETDESGPKPGDYLAAPIWARIVIVVAGVAMNYLLAYILFVWIFAMGRPVPGTTIGTFVDGYPAKEAGLVAGDRIIQAEGQPVRTWNDLTDAIQKGPETGLTILVSRPASSGVPEQLTVTLSPRIEKVRDIFGHETEIKRLGIMPNPEANEFEKFGIGESFKKAGETVWTMTALTHKAIFYLVQGKLSIRTMSGPIGIIAMTGTAAKLGLTYVLQLTATLSISLAVINLLPIPALDGGHFLFLLIEAVQRKRVSLEFQERLTQIGFILLMVLMVFIIYNDLVNLNVFEKIKALFPINRS